MILIGNKSDKIDKRAVTEDQGRQLAHELGIKFMETSVHDNVEEAFFTLARSVVPRKIATGDLAQRTFAQRLQDPSDRLPSRSHQFIRWLRKREQSLGSQPASSAFKRCLRLQA